MVLFQLSPATPKRKYYKKDLINRDQEGIIHV